MTRLGKHVFVPLALSLGACGYLGKHSSNDTSGGGTPPPPDASTLTVDPQALAISSKLPDTNPNAINVDATGRGKVHATFTFKADASYSLAVESVSHTFKNCTGAEPTPVLSWSGDDMPTAQALTEGAAFTASSSKNYTLALDVDNSTGGCKGITVSFAVVVQPGVPAPPSPSPAPADIDYKNFAVIREFAEKDTAALFGILPSNGVTLSFNEVDGPQFLGNAHVGVLDQDFLAKAFTKGAHPLSDADRQKVLAAYKGATVIYFEGYDGNLCSSDDEEVSATSAINGQHLLVDFKFVAVPQTATDCIFTQASMIETTSP